MLLTRRIMFKLVIVSAVLVNLGKTHLLIMHYSRVSDPDPDPHKFADPDLDPGKKVRK